MSKRFLDCNTSDFQKMSKRELLDAIRASEGRVIITEVIGAVQPLLYHISNAELACAFGSDILLLNMFDVYHPVFHGLGDIAPDRIVTELKRLTGRILGINLEPVMENSGSCVFPEGRTVSAATAKKALEMGADFIVITGNPDTSVSNQGIVEGIRIVRETVGDRLFIGAGKMHAAGVMKESGAAIVSKQEIGEFLAAGCDMVLFPAPGTVPGITMEYIRELVSYTHGLGALTITTIGTSQEGTDDFTIREIALLAKMTGTDLHHLGDAGFPGVAIPENILNYGLAIRGRRHTYSRMARSVNR